MDFREFLRLESPDFKDRMLSEIWDYSDEEIETTHDFIQIVFPLNKPSNRSIHGFYIRDDSVLADIRSDEVIQRNLIKSSKWFLSFLIRNPEWKTHRNHNQFRITRIIECLRLLVSDDEADAFKSNTFELLEEANEVNEVTLKFWENA